MFDAQCPECLAPRHPTTAEAVAVVATAPERFAACFATLARDRWSAEPAPGVWAPVAYLWHVVDVLRFGAERLWMLRLDPTSNVVPWDADEIAAARGYPGLSVEVGRHALAQARDVWLDAFATTPADAAAPHPEIGRMTAAVMAERNAHEVVHHAMDIARPRRVALRPGGDR
jgi:DinB superfamily